MNARNMMVLLPLLFVFGCENTTGPNPNSEARYRARTKKKTACNGRPPGIDSFSDGRRTQFGRIHHPSVAAGCPIFY